MPAGESEVLRGEQRSERYFRGSADDYDKPAGADHHDCQAHSEADAEAGENSQQD